MADLNNGIPAGQSSGTGVYANKPVDTERHATTKVRGDKNYETTVFEFKNPRKVRMAIYRGNNGLPWALMDLVTKTNSAINNKEIEGKPIGLGSIIQACVVRYCLNDQVYEPQTAPDSPLYATLPHKIIEAEEGYLITKIAVDEEMLIHFKPQKLVGDLIPILKDEEKEKVLVTLQMKEAVSISKQAELDEFLGKLTGVKYALGENVDDEAKEFKDFLATNQDKSKEWSDLTTHLDGVGSDVQVEVVGSLNDFIKQADREKEGEKALQRKAAELDQQNFGFR